MITMCIDSNIHTHQMRTNILIDDDLMSAAMIATGVKSKKEAVEMGLKALVRLNRQQSIRQFKGKLKWDGDLDVMRTDG
jgi:Arc/MetJ family transcription regulator